MELYAKTIALEEVEKVKEALLEHERKAKDLQQYIAAREAEERRKRLH